MPPVKRLMIITDFSDAGNEAVRYGFELAAQLGATALLVTVVDKDKHESHSYIDMSPVHTGERLKKDVEQATEALRKLIPEDLAATVKYEVAAFVDADPVKGILRAARELGADLMVMASHRRSGLVELVTGSTASKLLHHAVCPLLIIKISDMT